MHAYLIVGGDAVTREQEIERQIASLGVNRYDCIAPESAGQTIGIAEIRTFCAALSLRPIHGTQRAGIIAHAESLTIDAQQALLKTLEEPPTHATLFLAAPHDAILLPTVVSRCIKISVSDGIARGEHAASNDVRTILTRLPSLSIGERISLCETIGKSKDEILAWIDTALVILEDSLRASVSTKQSGHLPRALGYRIRRLMRAKQQMQGNIHPLLALEHALIIDDEL